mmetsp:Transcript_4544/g.6928  ORF Transcript_4544/g.6928 Transcript_4544/m.6928 type:complete len:266 (-) Transcript_4544:299-1096(-)
MIDYTASKNEVLSPLDPPRMIRVLAPADLPPGYELSVETKESASFTVVIPRGGVQEGEIFLAPIPQGYTMEEVIDSPRGRWKDGTFDLFRYGIFHSHFCCALFCREIAMGQVMQRMRLSWTGSRTLGDRALNTFRTVLILVICYIIFDVSLTTYMNASIKVDNYGYYDVSDINPVVRYLQQIGGLMFTCWSIYALYKTRQNVRSEFSIPEEQCIGCEDIVCASFCGCCTVAQIARHTGDYDTHPGLFCSETGLPDHAPLAAPMTV